MTTPEDREQELRRKELEIQAREQEIRLRELEIQLHQEQRQAREMESSLPPLYETKKHNPPESYLKRVGKKFVKFVKFAGFLILGIAFIRAGFWLGMWIAYLGLAGIITFIGYQIFLNDDD